MLLTLVRHSEVIAPYQGKYNGHIDIALSHKGKEDASALGKTLSHLKFDKIYCSDLLRARETLEALQRQEDVIYTSRLREKSWGEHEGMSFDEIVESGIEYRGFLAWIETLGGEPIESYKERLLCYFQESIFTNEAQHILIVTHSGVIKTLLGSLKNLSLEESFSLKLPYSASLTLDMQDYGL